MVQEKIGLFIKQKRTEKDLTQKDLAKKLNVTVQAVSKWERGRGIPDVSILDDLSKELDTSIVEILKGEDQEDKDDKNVAESIKYANKSFKQRINSNIMKICWILLIFALVITGMKYGIYYYFRNKSYDSYLDYSELNLTELNKETFTYIDTLKSSQGNYSDQEYSVITTNIEQYESAMSDGTLLEIVSKDKIKYTDAGTTADKIQYNSVSYKELAYVVEGRKLYNNLEAEIYPNKDGKIYKEIDFTSDYAGVLEYYYNDLFVYQTITANTMFDAYKYANTEPGYATAHFIYLYVIYYHDSLKSLVEMGGYNEEA